MISKLLTISNFSDSFSYSLIKSGSSFDNDLFYITNDSLFTRISFDYEDKNEYTIWLKSESSDQLLSFEKIIKINILDVDEIKPEISLTSNIQNELSFILSSNEPINKPIILINGNSIEASEINETAYTFKTQKSEHKLNVYISVKDIAGNESILNETFLIATKNLSANIQVDEILELRGLAKSDTLWVISIKRLEISHDTLINLSSIYLIKADTNINQLKLAFTLSQLPSGDSRKVGLYNQNGEYWVYLGGEATKHGSFNYTLQSPVSGSYSIFYNENHEFYIPETFVLNQNFPNPFNPSTTITFELPKNSRVNLSIFNILGQKIKTLVNKELDARIHQFEWNGTNQLGQNVSSGILLLSFNNSE